MSTLADDLAEVLERAAERGVEIHVGPARGALSPEEVAEWLGVSVATVYRLMERRELPYVQLTPKIRRIARSALEQFVRAGNVEAAS